MSGDGEPNYEILITGIACGAVVAAAASIAHNFAKYLATPGPRPESDAKSFPPSPKQASESVASALNTASDQGRKNDNFIPCSAVAKYCTATSTSQDAASERNSNSDANTNTASSNGSKHCTNNNVVAKNEATYKDSVFVPCEMIPFFYKECQENTFNSRNCGEVYQPLMRKCHELERASSISGGEKEKNCDDTARNSVEIDDINLLLIPFEECMKAAENTIVTENSMGLASCWENYGKYLKAFGKKA